MRDNGHSYREIAEEFVNVGKDRARRICERKDDYETIRNRTRASK